MVKSVGCRKISGAVVDEHRDPSATGQGRGGSAAPPSRPVVRGAGWRAGEGVDGDGEVKLFGAVDLATVVSVWR